jgi:hypothetical protein
MRELLWLTIQSCPNWFSSLIYQNTSIIIKLHHAAIRSLVFLHRPHHHRMPDISSSDLVCSCGRHTSAGAGLWTEIPLLLHDDYDTIAWKGLEKPAIE